METWAASLFWGCRKMVMVMASMYVERYRAVRERLAATRLRGTDEVERCEDELRALWAAMSDADRRTVNGVGERPEALKRAA